MELAVKILFFVQGLCLVYAYPEGAPVGTCAEFGYPRHGAASQTTPSPYKIVVTPEEYSPGDTITVTLTSDSNKDFEGYVVYASRASGNIEEPIGKFTQLPSNAKLLSWYDEAMDIPTENCVTHEKDDHMTSLEFTWEAPAVSHGDIVFRATFLEEFETFWTNVMSVAITAIVTDANPTFEADLQGGNMAAIELDGVCGKTKGCFLYPPDCSENDCDVAVTFSASGAGYQFQMMGKSDGYVAMGFSTDEKMGGDETFHCVANDGQLAFHRGVNPGETNYRFTKTGITDVYVTREDGYVKCSFFRPASMSVVNMETGKKDIVFDLANENYYLQVAWGGAFVELPKKHKTLPFTSKSKVNFNKFSVVSAELLPNLVRVHGLFGLLGWTALAGCGAILARHFRQELTKKSCGVVCWLGGHQSLMINAVIQGTVAIIIIFIYKGEFTHNKSAKIHAILGLVATALGLFNLLGGFLRPGPDSPRRRVFNWIHRLWGIGAWVIAIATVFLGMNIDYIHPDLSDTGTLVLAVWVGLQVAWEIVLEIIGCFQRRSGDSGKTSSSEMQIQDPNAKSSDTIKRVKLVCLGLFILTQIACFICAVVILYTNEF